MLLFSWLYKHGKLILVASLSLSYCYYAGY